MDNIENSKNETGVKKNGIFAIFKKNPLMNNSSKKSQLSDELSQSSDSSKSIVDNSVYSSEDDSYEKDGSSDVEEFSGSSTVRVDEKNYQLIINELYSKLNRIESARKETGVNFSRMNMVIGELRGKILEQEKYILKLEARSAILDDLFKTIDPTSMSRRFEEEVMHIEAVESKIDSFMAVVGSVREEIEKVDSKVKSIGSQSDLLRLNKDVSKMLSDVLREHSRLSIELEKSQSLFLEMQKNYSSSLKHIGMLSEMEGAVHKLSVQQDKFEISLHNYVPRDLMNSKITELNKFISGLEDKYKRTVENVGLREEAVLSGAVRVSDALRNMDSSEEVEKLVEFNKILKMRDEKKYSSIDKSRAVNRAVNVNNLVNTTVNTPILTVNNNMTDETKSNASMNPSKSDKDNVKDSDDEDYAFMRSY